MFHIWIFFDNINLFGRYFSAANIPIRWLQKQLVKMAIGKCIKI